MHRYILHNEDVVESTERCLSPGQVGLLNGWGVFSTLRVIDGVIFVFEKHWERMRRDAVRFRVPFPSDPRELFEPLRRLVQANQAWDATLRVAIVRNRGGLWEGPGIDRDFDIIAFTTDPKPWPEAVRLGVVHRARYAAWPFAGTKILSWCHNLTWLEEAECRGLDEVILLNEHGLVSECTSANVFISKGHQVWTPPLSSGCLPGITREILLNEIHIPSFEVAEKDLSLQDLEQADEVFITSTTRGLLPVASIEGLNIRREGRALEPLRQAYEQYVRDYVARAKAEGKSCRPVSLPAT